MQLTDVTKIDFNKLITNNAITPSLNKECGIYFDQDSNTSYNNETLAFSSFSEVERQRITAMYSPLRDERTKLLTSCSDDICTNNKYKYRKVRILRSSAYGAFGINDILNRYNKCFQHLWIRLSNVNNTNTLNTKEQDWFKSYLIDQRFYTLTSKHKELLETIATKSNYEQEGIHWWYPYNENTNTYRASSLSQKFFRLKKSTDEVYDRTNCWKEHTIDKLNLSEQTKEKINKYFEKKCDNTLYGFQGMFAEVYEIVEYFLDNNIEIPFYYLHRLLPMNLEYIAQRCAIKKNPDNIFWRKIKEKLESFIKKLIQYFDKHMQEDENGDTYLLYPIYHYIAATFEKTTAAYKELNNYVFEFCKKYIHIYSSGETIRVNRAITIRDMLYEDYEEVSFHRIALFIIRSQTLTYDQLEDLYKDDKYPILQSYVERFGNMPIKFFANYLNSFNQDLIKQNKKLQKGKTKATIITLSE